MIESIRASWDAKNNHRDYGIARNFGVGIAALKRPGNLTSDAIGFHFSSFGGARGGVSGSKYPEDTTLPIVSTWNPISCK